MQFVDCNHAPYINWGSVKARSHRSNRTGTGTELSSLDQFSLVAAMWMDLYRTTQNVTALNIYRIL